MNKEHDEYLCKVFPNIFKDRYAPMTETCMCWGFDCGDGWFNIINQLCQNIQNHIEWNNKNFEKGYAQYKQVPQVVATQVKEKFGSLRFYYDGGDDFISGLVSMAESMSGVTCECCGVPTTSRTIHGWVTTLCEACEGKNEILRAEALAKYNAEHEETYKKTENK